MSPPPPAPDDPSAPLQRDGFFDLLPKRELWKALSLLLLLLGIVYLRCHSDVLLRSVGEAFPATAPSAPGRSAPPQPVVPRSP